MVVWDLDILFESLSEWIVLWVIFKIFRGFFFNKWLISSGVNLVCLFELVLFLILMFSCFVSVLIVLWDVLSCLIVFWCSVV